MYAPDDEKQWKRLSAKAGHAQQCSADCGHLATEQPLFVCTLCADGDCNAAVVCAACARRCHQHKGAQGKKASLPQHIICIGQAKRHTMYRSSSHNPRLITDLLLFFS